MSIVVNEVHTIPGFTNISMYPLAFNASGVSRHRAKVVAAIAAVTCMALWK